jgi:hypothetical protein
MSTFTIDYVRYTTSGSNASVTGFLLPPISSEPYL